MNNNVLIKKKKSSISIIINKYVLNGENVQKKIEEDINNFIIARRGGLGFSVLSPTNQINDFGFNSPLNINANQFNTKLNNFSIAAETSLINSTFNTNYNPLKFLSSPYNMNKNAFSYNSIQKDDNIENLVNPLSNLANKNEDKNDYFTFYQDDEPLRSPKKKSQLPSLNLDIINKADTTKIFAESVLSYFYSSPTNDVKKSFCVSNKHQNDEYIDISTKNVSNIYNSTSRNYIERSPRCSTPLNQVYFNISPKTCLKVVLKEK